MCCLNIHKGAVFSYIFILLFTYHNSNGHLYKRSPDLEKAQNLDDTKSKIISEEDPRKDPGADPGKPDTMPHSVARRQSYASFSRLYLCKWLNPREELLPLQMCTKIGDFPYLNECRVFRHCINVGSTTIKACCPVGCHFDHILRECVQAKDARCLARDLKDQFSDSAFYEESAVEVPHSDVVHVDDYVDNVHDEPEGDVVIDDVDDDSEPIDDSFEVIDPSVLANSDKAWKYYPAPPHLYPGAFWNHNPYTGKMEPGKYGYAMPIWMSYSVEPVQKIRQPRRRLWMKPGLYESEEYDPKAGLGEEGDGDETGEGDNKDGNEKSTQPNPPDPVTPVTIVVPSSESTPTSSEQSVVIPIIPVQPPAPPPPFVIVKPATKPPLELITFTTKQPDTATGSDEDNGFDLGKNPEDRTTPKSPPIDNQKVNAPIGRKSDEPPPPIRGIPGKSGFDVSSEEQNGNGKKKRSGEIGDDILEPVPVTQSITQSQVTPRQVEIDEGVQQSEPQLSVLPDFENSIEQEAISNGDIQSQTNTLVDRGNNFTVKNNNLTVRPSQSTSQQNGGEEQIQSQPSPKRKRQVPMSMMRRRVIPRRTPDYFYYNY